MIAGRSLSASGWLGRVCLRDEDLTGFSERSSVKVRAFADGTI